mmetsp:Transcript_11272/g.32415  ORF Transcript_11272/g.32415 Transcript_11272/m.32415 type:complete len:253 (+) Transcript_11272:121-879(+)
MLFSAPAKVDLTSQPPRGLRRRWHIRMVACGANHTCVIDDDGTALAWGCGDCGRLGRNPAVRDWSRGHGGLHPLAKQRGCPPDLVQGLEGLYAVNVACGSWHTALLVSKESPRDTAGEVYTFGSGLGGQLGLGDVRQSHRAQKVEHVPACSLVRAGKFMTAVVTAKNQTVYCWGSQGCGMFFPTPARIPLADSIRCGPVVDIACSSDCVTILTAGSCHSRSPLPWSFQKLPPPHSGAMVLHRSRARVLHRSH